MRRNWNVITGLAAVGPAVWMLAPNLTGATLPLLLVAACPLSMLLASNTVQKLVSREASLSHDQVAVVDERREQVPSCALASSA